MLLRGATPVCIGSAGTSLVVVLGDVLQSTFPYNSQEVRGHGAVAEAILRLGADEVPRGTKLRVLKALARDAK